jgi:hypothetical protein
VTSSAPAPTPGTGDPRNQADDQLLMFGLLRQIRASAQSVDTVLSGLESALTKTDAQERWLALRKMADESKASISTGVSSGAEYLAQLVDLIGRAPEIRDWIGDEVTGIQLTWASGVRGTTAIDADLSGLQIAPDQKIVDRLIRSLQLARPQMSRVIVVTATYTIPNRLNQWLAQTRPGRSLNFKSMFVNELPGEAERTEVLRQIDDAPGEINGIVDLATGTVVAISPKQSRRRLSYLLEIATLVLGGILTYFVIGVAKGYVVVDSKGIHPVDQAAETALATLATILFAFVGGAALHFIVNLLKARQGAAGSSQWATVDDWLIWVHAREMRIVTSIVGLWFVFGSLVFIFPDQALDTLGAFFAGYSFDSLIDLVINRFDAFAAPKIKQVTEVVAGPPTA